MINDQDMQDDSASAGPVFGHIDPIPLTERITAALKNAFFPGQLKPGDSIVERSLQRARSRVTEAELNDLKKLADNLVDAGEHGNRREFLEHDFAFHRFCRRLSGNSFLAETLERLMAPLFVFVVLASGRPLTAAMGKEHYTIVEALKSVPEPEFSALVRKTITGFALRWTSGGRT